MDSCAVCKDLVPFPGPSGGFINGGDGENLEASAPNCRLCSILWEGLVAFAGQAARSSQWMALKPEQARFRLQYKYSTDDRLWKGLHFYTKDASNPFSGQFYPDIDLDPDTGCSRYRWQALDWIKDCCEQHESCKAHLTDWLPKRVLDLSISDDLVFLAEPNKTDRGPYVALSHCWGGIVPIRTLRSTFSQFKDGIPMESLPTTFRQAVQVTRQLGCAYLWIDSLCIIQDDKEDWTQQAVQMAMIYGRSYVTIAATASANSSQGLFRQHQPRNVKHIIERVLDGDQHVVYAKPSLEHSPYYDSSPYGLGPSVSAPLLERAWCFQEYILAPRVLCFTQWEILWACSSHRACNCGLYSKYNREIVNESDLKARFSRELQGSTEGLLRLWKDIVAQYSLKKITYEEDRLPALAGIAYLFTGKGLGRYINGLWETTLSQDLFWRQNWALAAEYGVIVRRSSNLAMPSWAWTSVTGPVEDLATHLVEGLELIDISYEASELGALTRVCARTITLRGYLIDAWAWKPRHTHGTPASPHRRIRLDSMSEMHWVTDVTTDVACDETSPMRVHIFGGTKGPQLILCRKSDTNNTYQRLGMTEGLRPEQMPDEPIVVRLV
ncbi:HET-domain-containing protein [Xylariomycetidae sp. FL0641]|nr:HET-domain-containing protein [Xylariomycetidae sp. FL0641]